MRVLIAGSDASFIKTIKEILAPVGYQVIGEADDGITALQLVRTIQPDLVILESSLPGMDGLEVGKIVEESRLAPVIVIASYREANLINERGELPFPILPKPVEPHALTSMIEYIQNSFKRFIALETEVKRLRNDLATRKLVEKAKGLLMKEQGLSEDAAYKKMRKLSMKKRKSMKKIAEAIVMAYDIQK